MAPVVRALADNKRFSAGVCVTAQHRQMLDQVLSIFEIAPDYDLDLMRPEQDLAELTGRILVGVRDVLRRDKPDLVLVQGDTTTCMAAALAAFYERIPIGHVEAGLRSGRLDAPFPEEANRSIVGRIAALHFAPTIRARNNLLAEGLDAQRIFVTGNTVIDALLMVRERLRGLDAAHWRDSYGDRLVAALAGSTGTLVLITGHRRESFGRGFRDLCAAVRDLAIAHPDWLFIYPVHVNPQVQQPVGDILGGIANVHLITPLDYLSFVWLMDRAHIILTDSGGIQEEAPSLGKPVLVMREVTERIEAVEAGTAKLVGTDRARIRTEVERLASEQGAYAAMAGAKNPYGDGKASMRILERIRLWKGLQREPGIVGV
jgi:UDP-N-acetylglucosamine 2-epimerase (non-hydrolysing)